MTLDRLPPPGAHRIRRWWAVILLLPGVVAAAGCRASAGLQPSFRATATTCFTSAAPGQNLASPVTHPQPVAAIGHALPEPASEPLAGPACEQVVDLPMALAAAGADNPTIALATALVQVADSERLAADALLLPTLRGGGDFDLHRGNLLSAGGIIRDVDRQSAYVGAGAFAVGTGTVVIPGVRVFAHLADACFEPAIARQKVTEAKRDASAINNVILLEVALRYFDLLGAQARLAALRETQEELRDLATQTANFATTGQGRQADADRAASEFALNQIQVDTVREQIGVAAAELARLLHWDPSVPVVAAGPLIDVRLLSGDEPLEALVQTATASRPEIGARSAAVAAASTRLREEEVRPFLPLLSAGYSAGGFGGGSNLADTQFGHFIGRGDFDALAVWSLDNAGLGNLATQRQRRAELVQTQAERIAAVDLVRREVAEAHAEVSARLLELQAARRGLSSAQQGYRLDAARLRNLEGLPIELLNSINLLTAARLDVIRAIIAQNQAQFRLYVALGQPPIVRWQQE